MTDDNGVVTTEAFAPGGAVSFVRVRTGGNSVYRFDARTIETVFSIEAEDVIEVGGTDRYSEFPTAGRLEANLSGPPTGGAFQDVAVSCGGRRLVGGGSGIGRAIAIAFADRGAGVFIVGRREAPLRETAAERPEAIEWQMADVTVANDAKRIVEAAVERFGRLDVLVNNAADGVMRPLADTDDVTMDRLVAVNFTSPLRMAREALPHLDRTKGQVVNMGSTTANVALPGTTIYSATKAALNQATRVLAAELGPAGIRVNLIAPGPTETDAARSALDQSPPGMAEQMIAQSPFRRLGIPEDVAKAVLMVTGDDAGWITGQIINASGGFMS
ncbi:MAG: SDR family oxidoreductase [Myxococcota bacterium]